MAGIVVSMKKVFDLAEELRSNPARVELTQNLTLNAGKPNMGLKGSNGLFGSPDWWQSIRTGSMPTKTISGVITKAYFVGPGGTGPNNMVNIITDEGNTESIGIYVNDPSDVDLFEEGHRTEITYALDELKHQPSPEGLVNYSRVALAMSVSAKPAAEGSLIWPA